MNELNKKIKEAESRIQELLRNQDLKKLTDNEKYPSTNSSKQKAQTESKAPNTYLNYPQKTTIITILVKP